MYESYQALQISRRGKVLTITLANPPVNAMTRAMHAELARVFSDINHDPDTAVVVLTGAGNRAFSAGGDLKALADKLERRDYSTWPLSSREAREIVYGLLRLQRPLIVRVNGHAMGMGATLAAFADFSYMLENARIADNHVSVGLSAGDGGALIWPFLVGFGKARHHLLTGEALTGREAADIGLITASAADMAALDEMTWAMAERLESGASLAINATKISINLVLRGVLEGLVDAHMALESETHLSSDHLEAVTALRDGRKPAFKGC